jgi:peptide/nickel transport system permease protein
MQRYVMQRIMLFVPSILILSLIIFVVARLAPVDTISVMLLETGVQDEELTQQIRERLGLTDSIPRQYLSWIGHVLIGDFGQSWFTGQTISNELKHRIPVSLELGLISLIFSAVLSIPIGMIAAIKQDRWPDYVTRGGAILLLAIPNFWLGIAVVGAGYYWFSWAPPIEYKTWLEDPGQHALIMMWPVILLAVGLSGTKMRLVRSTLLEVLRQDYVRTARAKGLTESLVLWRHVLRNALIPFVTVVGLQLPIIVAGSVVLESIFLLPGVGRYIVEASTRYDFPIMQGVVLVVAAFIMITNLLVDLSYVWLDPRIRYRS